MAEKDLTKKLTQVLKDADKLVQDIERVIGAVGELSAMLLNRQGKDNDESDE